MEQIGLLVHFVMIIKQQYNCVINTIKTSGCTDSTYHALMVYKYEMNGEIVNSIPIFKSYEACKYLIKNHIIKLYWGQIMNGIILLP